MKIFVCYRRVDTEDAADRLGAVFRRHVDRRSGKAVDVFIDLHEIQPGEVWEEVLANRVAECEVMLVLLGRQWLTLRDERTGLRRLDLTDDPVRREIRIAMEKNKKIVPVLFAGASEPADQDPVPEVAALAKRQSYAVRRQSFETDCDELARRLGLMPLPPPQPHASPRPKTNPWPWLAAIAAVSLGAVAAWYFWRPVAPSLAVTKIVFGPDKSNPISVVADKVSIGDITAIWDWALLAVDDPKADRMAAAEWLKLDPRGLYTLRPEEVKSEGNQVQLPEGLVFCRAFTSPDYTRIDVQDDRGESLRIIGREAGLEWYASNIVHATVYLAAAQEKEREKLVARGICAEPKELLSQRGRATCRVPNVAYFNWQISCN